MTAELKTIDDAWLHIDVDDDSIESIPFISEPVKKKSTRSSK